MPDEAAARLIASVDAAFREFRALVDQLREAGLGRTTPTGWTVKEMLAHVAFWQEAGTPVIRYMFRGKEIPDPWEFGSGPFWQKDHPEGWPPADVHNAREAAWGREHTAAEVLARWDRAHAGLLETLATVTGREVEGKPYFAEIAEHLQEHKTELEAMLAASA